MFEFDQSGIIAKITLGLIQAVNKAYPELPPETIAMAFMTASIEKAVVAKIQPMDYLIALSMAWTFVAGMQEIVTTATGTLDSAEPPAVKAEAPIFIVKQPKGVH